MLLTRDTFLDLWKVRRN